MEPGWRMMGGSAVSVLSDNLKGVGVVWLHRDLEKHEGPCDKAYSHGARAGGPHDWVAGLGEGPNNSATTQPRGCAQGYRCLLWPQRWREGGSFPSRYLYPKALKWHVLFLFWMVRGWLSNLLPNGKMVSLHVDHRLTFSNSPDFKGFLFVGGRWLGAMVNCVSVPPIYFYYSLRKWDSNEVCEAKCSRCFLSSSMAQSFPRPLSVHRKTQGPWTSNDSAYICF